MILALEPTVQISIIAAFASVIVALLGLLAEAMRRNHNAVRAIKKDTVNTKEQVANSHSTNLREDIDVITGLVEKVAVNTEKLRDGQANIVSRVSELRNDQHQSRVDAAQERVERQQADARIDAHITRVAITAAQVATALAIREKQEDNTHK